jgi:UDP-N-acetylmuramate dehydrogenase
LNLDIQHHISLKNYNTFGIAVNAAHFVAVTSVEELIAVLQLDDYPEKFVLGGGSNILFTQDIHALVIHITTKGKEIVYEDEKTVKVKVAAGENWHEFVLWTLEHHFGGVENLSLIPGNVGAAPIQNIGAYGVELKDVFVACEAVEIATRQLKQFTRNECKFGYRNSIFKNEAKGKYSITSVTLQLTKKEHRLHTGYGSIEALLKKQGITQPTPKQISDTVIAIRKSKLPDPKILGNSGSFFKNPIITTTQFKKLKRDYPAIPSYPALDDNENDVKIPAGWLIEQCGFKGKRIGDVGVHEKQALVLVNYGRSTGKEILAFAHTIQTVVKNTFGICIEAEVNIV